MTARQAKVPILVLNATSLNTCHNWQFTATFMGEPPARNLDSEVDTNDRLRRSASSLPFAPTWIRSPTPNATG